MPQPPTNPPPPEKPQAERFPEEPSGGWTQPERPSYPPPAQPTESVAMTGSKIVTGILSMLIVGLAGWVWKTNTELTRLQTESSQYVTVAQMAQYLATQERMLEKVNIVYERIVLNPSKPPQPTP